MVRTQTGTIQRNSDAPTPFDPLPFIESAEIVIYRVVRICVQVVVGVRDLTVKGVDLKVLGERPSGR